MINTRFATTLTLLLALCFNNTHAQMIRRAHATTEIRPEVILVQLPSLTRKIEYFKKRKRNAELVATIEKDAVQIREAMVRDFNDNFKFCPVYFYIDTNAAKVKAKNFSGILMDKSMLLISNTENTKKPYQIVIYTLGGSTTSDYEESGSTTPKDAAYNTGSNEPHLIVYDEHFNRIKTPAPNGTSGTITRAMFYHVDNAEYRYKSKVQDYTYYPFAEQISHKMEKFYQ